MRFIGHIVFICLHLLACLFGFVLLLVTVPLHLIWAAVSRKKSA